MLLHASRLKGFHAAITLGNAPTVDILVSSHDGAATVALQVKTTKFAVRTQGRGDEKKPYQYQWAVGKRSAHTPAREDLIYAFVDLRNFAEVPDIFFVPSSVVTDWCSKSEREFEAKGKEWKWYRMHVCVETFEPHKNNWELLRRKLAGQN